MRRVLGVCAVLAMSLTVGCEQEKQSEAPDSAETEEASVKPDEPRAEEGGEVDAVDEEEPAPSEASLKKAEVARSAAENAGLLGSLEGSQVGGAQGFGGLGLSGSGKGGGGTAQGIGLGNIGTAGRGGGARYGSSAGLGSRRADIASASLSPSGGELSDGVTTPTLEKKKVLGDRKARVPKIVPGKANVKGSLDKEIIRRVVRQHRNEIRYCYERELQRDPSLAGKVDVKFTISGTGSIAAAVVSKSTMGNARVERCMTSKIKRWAFPQPRGGGVVIVNYPFTFEGGDPSYKKPEPPKVVVNPMVETSKDRFSTFAVDVDTGSYTLARRQLKSGYRPDPHTVRVEEFVNYFNYDYPDPDAGAFGVNLEAAPSPFTAEKNRYLLRVGVQGKRVAPKDRKPVHLTFLVDVSGSMNRPDKLGLAKKALKILTNNLKKGDTVALTTYAGSTRVVLPPTGMKDRAKILAALDDLRSGGGTAMNSGMKLAYQQAMKAHKPGHVNRVIVLSDGDANIGPSSHDQILEQIQSYVDEGITMSTIGFGINRYRGRLMEQLSNKGNGNYYYIDTEREAERIFGEQLDGTLEVIAKDVKIQVEFNPDVVSQYRLIGYENRDIADKDFRNDRVDAGEIGAGHTVTALYEVITKPEVVGTVAHVRVRHKKPDGYKASEQSFLFSAQDVRAKLSDASKDFQFAAAVVAFAEVLRGSPHAEGLSLALVEELAQSASSANQRDRQEFIELVRAAKAAN